MSDNWFYEYFINEAKSIIRPCSGGSVPKPLTYDYMPEGYPSKSVQTVTLMEEQEVEFAFVSEDGIYVARLSNAFAIAEGQTYTVNWDGTEYECVGVGKDVYILGNPSIGGMGDDTGEPFLYGYLPNESIGTLVTLDTSASHTISVKTVTEVITPMAYDYMPEGYPSKSGLSIEWDGNTDGLVSVLEMFYKVSDLVPTDDELIGSTIKLSNRNKVKITSAYIHAVSEDITYAGHGDIFIVVVKKDNTIFEDTTFPQKGTYFAKQQGNKVAQAKPLYIQKLTGAITPMAEEFIPTNIVEDIGAVADVANNAKTAAENAQTTAENAQTTANSAQGTAYRAETTAINADITATNAQTTADNARTTADNARTTADAAKTTADNARTTADNARTTADAAKTTATNAQTTADAAKAALDKALIVEPNGNIFPPIRYMNDGAYQSLVLTSKDQKHQTKFAITESTGLEITVCRDGGVVSSTSANPSTVNFKSNGANSIQLSGINALIMSPINSTKKFKITVDDTGTLSATEVT